MSGFHAFFQVFPQEVPPFINIYGRECDLVLIPYHGEFELNMCLILGKKGVWCLVSQMLPTHWIAIKLVGYGICKYVVNELKSISPPDFRMLSLSLKMIHHALLSFLTNVKLTRERKKRKNEDI